MDPNQILEALVLIVVFVFSIVVHENAHGVAAERFGDPTARHEGRITMNPLPHIDPIGSIIMPLLAFVSNIPLIGWAKPVPVNSANLRNPVVHNAYVAAAGPASNFLLAIGATFLLIVVGLFYKHLGAGGDNTQLFFVTFCRGMIEINCLLGIFNLIPVPPLDGHWILMRYLPPRQREVLAMIRPYGFFILLLLLWTGGLGVIISVVRPLLTGNLYSFAIWAINTL